MGTIWKAKLVEVLKKQEVVRGTPTELEWANMDLKVSRRLNNMKRLEEIKKK